MFPNTSTAQKNFRGKAFGTEKYFTALPDDAEKAIGELLNSYGKETFGFFMAMDRAFR